jgi:succinyl-diaminopimelate desuccinylase
MCNLPTIIKQLPMTETTSETIKLAQQIIQIDSVTPDDKGCQKIISDYLDSSGFTAEKMNFEDTQNLWLRRGTQSPFLVFAGHTDVVPTGDVANWTHPPFEAKIVDGMMYGRGTADMKGSIACFMVASKRFVKNYPNHKGSIGYLITSDEEGPAINGTVKVIETLEKRNEKIDWCLVGEPSSEKKLGDTIKNGRRGSLSANFSIIGKQGHVAYPHLAENPLFSFAPALEELKNTIWDQGNDFFPATTFQISNINAGTGANNVIPGELKIMSNFRFSTELTPDAVKEKFTTILDKHNLKYTIDWNLSGMPFVTEPGELVSGVVDAIKTVTGIDTKLSTSGGTSDGRFIAPTGSQVLEIGPLNKTIHQVDERVGVDDLNQLTEIYYETLVNLLGQ